MADCVTSKEVLSSSLASYIVLPVCLITSLKSEVKPEENFPPSHPVQDLQGNAHNLGLDAKNLVGPQQGSDAIYGFITGV